MAVPKLCMAEISILLVVSRLRGRTLRSKRSVLLSSIQIKRHIYSYWYNYYYYIRLTKMHKKHTLNYLG